MNIFSWRGRINRSKYFGRYFFLSIAQYTIYKIIQSSQGLSRPIVTLVVLGFTIFWYLMIVTTIKRLHDINRSGYHVFYSLVPFYNVYLSLLHVFKRGDTGTNHFGEDPLQDEDSFYM
jgi:uncharacterized membrane protein YhaH (DUF805 family)